MYQNIYFIMSDFTRPYRVETIPSRHAETQCHVPHQKLLNVGKKMSMQDLHSKSIIIYNPMRK